MGTLLFTTRRHVIALLVTATGLFAMTATCRATMTEATGGPGGSSFNFTCPAGQFLIGFYTRTGAWFDAIGIVCTPYNAATQRSAGIVRDPRMAGGSGGGEREKYCPASVPMSGMAVLANGKGRDQEHVDAIMIVCPATASETAHFICILSGETCVEDPLAHHLMDRHSCPSGERATGIHGRSGDAVNALGLICDPLPAASPPPTVQAGGPLRRTGADTLPSAAPPIAATPPASANKMLTGIDMPGKDYRNVVLNFSPTQRNNNQPVACQNICAIEAQCKAWTWVKLGVQGTNAMCWLKNNSPPRVANANTVSGLK